METDGYEVDEIWQKLDKPKKLNSGRKGRRGEREIVDLLVARFNMPFSRVPQSGNRMSQVALPEELKGAYVGDIVTPGAFKY